MASQKDIQCVSTIRVGAESTGIPGKNLQSLQELPKDCPLISQRMRAARTVSNVTGVYLPRADAKIVAAARVEVRPEKRSGPSGK